MSTKIVKPGYHIKPQYDLQGLRKRRAKSMKNFVAELPLTALLDLFTVILIFLLVNVGSSGDGFFASKGYVLPKATMTSTLQSAPLLSIVGTTFELEYPNGKALSVKDSSPNLDFITLSLKSQPTHEEKHLNLQAPEEASIGDVKKALSAAVAAGWTNINFVVRPQPNN